MREALCGLSERAWSWAWLPTSWSQLLERLRGQLPLSPGVQDQRQHNKTVSQNKKENKAYVWVREKDYMLAIVFTHGTVNKYRPFFSYSSI